MNQNNIGVDRKIKLGSAAGDFACGQGGETGTSPQQAVTVEPTQAPVERPVAELKGIFRSTPKFANQTSAQPVPFTVLHDSSVQLSPYGDFPHGKGLQRFDRTAADTLVNNFHSFSGKLGRCFAITNDPKSKPSEPCEPGTAARRSSH